jgi:hypothetical protein
MFVFIGFLCCRAAARPIRVSKSSERPRWRAEQQGAPIIPDIADTAAPRTNKRNASVTRCDARMNERSESCERSDHTEAGNRARGLLRVNRMVANRPGESGNRVADTVLISARCRACSRDAHDQSADRNGGNGAHHRGSFG